MKPGTTKRTYGGFAVKAVTDALGDLDVYDLRALYEATRTEMRRRRLMCGNCTRQVIGVKRCARCDRSRRRRLSPIHQRKKRAGYCVYGGCYEPPADGCDRCARHRHHDNQERKARRA